MRQCAGGGCLVGSLRARIHRGAAEIGGNCIELEAQGKRLVLDLGRPLWAERDEDVPLPPIDGLRDQRDPSLLGVVLSHAHLDHYGLLHQVDRGVPLYAGAASARILKAAAFFSPSGLDREWTGVLVDRKPLGLGPFTVTPFLVDHSAFDAYALLVEANGRRLFYSGDFRAHGRKASLMKRLFDEPPQGIHVLLLEGTRVRATGDEGAGSEESDVELAMADQFRSTAGLAVVFSSAQNIDRLVTVYRACRRAGRTLVVDLYASTIAATAKDTIPQSGFPGLRVYVPNRQRILVKEPDAFGRVDAIRAHRVFLEAIRKNTGEFAMLIQSSTLPEVAGAGCLDDAVAIWSLWSGYLDQPSGERLTRLLAEHDVPLRSSPSRAGGS